jgi:hypothetical protein
MTVPERIRENPEPYQRRCELQAERGTKGTSMYRS